MPLLTVGKYYKLGNVTSYEPHLNFLHVSLLELLTVLKTQGYIARVSLCGAISECNSTMKHIRFHLVGWQRCELVL